MGYGPAKQFDPDKALETAMKLFWEKGYAATSVDEIQKAMGIGRKSLYDTFGTKRELFIKALQHYVNFMLSQLRKGLAREVSPLKNVRNVLEFVVKRSNHPDFQGCFVSGTMAMERDEDIRRIVQHYLKHVETQFYQVFMHAQQIGEISQTKNIQELARVFTSTLQSIYSIGRIAEDTLLQESAVKASLKLLES